MIELENVKYYEEVELQKALSLTDEDWNTFFNDHLKNVMYGHGVLGVDLEKGEFKNDDYQISGQMYFYYPEKLILSILQKTTQNILILSEDCSELSV
jgi:hypothetical protein